MKRARPPAAKPLAVIGMGLGPQDLTARHLEIIASAEILIGGARLLAHFSGCPAEKKAVGKDVAETIAFIRRRLGRRAMVVLASGDPLFYGIGARLVEAFGADQVALYPNVSSVAAACARIGEPWGGMRVVSLHGRKDPSGLMRALAARETVAVLTDPERGPAWIARTLCERGVEGYRLCIFEALGSAGERYGWTTPRQALLESYRAPNLVILKWAPEPDPGPQPLYLGMPEERYARQDGLITKAEVRAVTLARLRLLPGHTLWDLGAGAGSIAIEASLLLRGGRIVAVEKEAGRAAQIRENARRFGVKGLRVVEARLPEGLAGLPPPDRVFIGGGGRELGSIIAAAATRLKPQGLIAVNTVVPDHLAAALAALRALAFVAELVQVQVSRGRAMPDGERLEALNPVWIVTGMRKAAA
jgi:precorrin-6Y C5,15-methyltransferase (decarboxylating)